MTGTLINAAAIIAAGLIGLFLRRGIPENYSRTIQDALGLLIIVIGVQYGFKADNLAVVGLSLAIGAVIGEWRQWESRLEKLGGKLQKALGREESGFVKGFVSATLLFCIGAMAVVGSLEDGLTGNHQILLVKSMLDGIFAMLFSASMGIGVLFSALPVLIYQGSISLGAAVIKPLLTDPMLNNITALGGIIIAGLGLNLLGLTRIKVANILPGIIVVPLLMALLKYLPL
ncbi:MAG TPA: DUF554 domain-containing protein [Syntrophomonadaceae bacterium]|nr:DUF554 domain-containing protein [Syntrophomonadaceae bacterium]